MTRFSRAGHPGFSQEPAERQDAKAGRKEEIPGASSVKQPTENSKNTEAASTSESPPRSVVSLQRYYAKNQSRSIGAPVRP